MCGNFGGERIGSICLEGSEREASSSGSLDPHSEEFRDGSWDEESELVLGEDTRVKEVSGSTPSDYDKILGGGVPLGSEGFGYLPLELRETEEDLAGLRGVVYF